MDLSSFLPLSNFLHSPAARRDWTTVIFNFLLQEQALKQHNYGKKTTKQHSKTLCKKSVTILPLPWHWQMLGAVVFSKKS